MTCFVRACLFALVLLAAASPAKADQEARELAGHFIDLSRLDERRAQLIEIMTAGFREASKNDPALSEAKLSDEERRDLFGVIQDEIEIFAGELAKPLRNNMVDFYVDRFSKDELRELIAIYESPVFAKQFDVLPELMQQNAAIAQSKMTEVQQRVASRVRAWMEEKRGR